MMKQFILLTAAFIAFTSSYAQKKSQMKKVDIQLIRNATLKLEYAGQTFLVDPVLSDKNSFMSFVVPDQNLNPTVDLPMSIKEISKGVDALLVTHAHPDHFDPKAMEVLDKELPLFTQASDKKALESTDFKNITYVESTATYKNISITRTGGKHGPEPLLEVLGQVSGFVLQANNYPTIYIVGDCLWDAEIEGNIEKYQPDIIITNSGGARFMGDSRILMDEKETVMVAQKAAQATVVAVHIGAIDHCPVTHESMQAAAKEAKVNILTPKNGETISL